MPRKKKNPDLSSRDKYLRKKFLITEEEYVAQLKKQGGVCICGRPPGARSLHVDHDHAIEKWKIDSAKFADGWWAWPRSGHGQLEFQRGGSTKSQAIRLVKQDLKRLSVRGLLCYTCNVGLQKFQDDPVRLRKASEYLERYYTYVGGNNNTTYFGKTYFGS